MPLRVRTISTSFGSKLKIGSFNVLVGPNNCGKSQTLRDIRDYVTSGSTSRLTILKEIELDYPTESEATNGLTVLSHSSPEHIRYLGVTYNLQNREEFTPAQTWLKNQIRLRQDSG